MRKKKTEEETIDGASNVTTEVSVQKPQKSNRSSSEEAADQGECAAANKRTRKPRGDHSQQEPVSISLMDVMRSGVNPNFYMEFMECARSLAELRSQVNFSDKDLLDAVTYFQCNQRTK